MKIGIIGSGSIGSTLARLWKRSGNDALISSRHPEQLSEIASEVGAQFGTPLEAATFGEAVLLAIPLSGTPDLEPSVRKALKGKVVIDTGNAYEERDRHAYNFESPHPKGSSGWVEEILEGSIVVKAFNTLYYKTLLSESGKGIATPIASDSEQGIRVASSLVRAAGYEPFVVGGLSEGRYFQPGTPAYGQGVSSSELAQLIQQAVGNPE